MRLIPGLLTLSLAFSVACSKKDKNDDEDTGSTVPTVNGGGPVPAGSGAVSLELSANSKAAFALNEAGLNLLVTDSMSFTPTGLKLPVMKITVAKDDSGAEEQSIYACAKATEEECLVDLADQTALTSVATAAGKAAVRAGSYERLSLYTCTEGKGGSSTTVAYLKGSTEFAGATWRTDTDAAGGAVFTGTDAATETKVGNWGCSTKNVLLHPALTVVDGTEVNLTVLVDNTFAAVFGNNVSNGMGGCKMDGSTQGGNSGNGVCMTYPALIPYVGTGKATTKRFAITHYLSSTVADAVFDDAKANAIVIVPVDAEGNGLMAFGRSFYTATSAQTTNNNGAANDLTYGGPTYVTETNFKTFTANGDGSVGFEQGGSADGNAGVFAAFQLKNHEGLVKTRDGSVTWAYRATALE